MYIFVDESGTFTAPKSAEADSWCIVAAYVSPEKDQDRLNRLVEQLRQDCGGGLEVKMNQIGEARYIRFLQDLSKLSGLAFAAAVDVSLHSPEGVAAHQKSQADKVVEHRGKVVSAHMRDQMTALSESIRTLPLQLYTQLQCQVELFHKVLCRAPLYYSQHVPETLALLSWRIDQKGTIPTTYEEAFRTILPASLQSKSLQEPMLELVGGNYEHFKRFEFAEGEFPTYLEKDYGIKTSGDGLDVGRMVREDFQLVDSKDVPGVQVADLLASGLRRLFRGRFERSHEVALGIGANMLTGLRDEPQVHLITLFDEATVTARTAELLTLLARKAKPLVP
jgi:hypothetical protein